MRTAAISMASGARCVCNIGHAEKRARHSASTSRAGRRKRCTQRGDL
jgi:hypothetical protein